MITTRITCVLNNDGFTTWQLRQLQQLSGYFQSLCVAYNITRSKQAILNNPLQMMSMGSCRYDVCHIAIEGRDAELACMILTEYLRTHATLCSSSYKHNHQTNSLFLSHPAFQLPFQYHWFTLKQEPLSDKPQCLIAISQQASIASSADLFTQLNEREKTAATILAPGIAIPHVVSPSVTAMTLCLGLPLRPIIWHSAYPPISLILGIILPESATQHQYQCITRLTRWLITNPFSQLLLEATQPETIKGTVLHIMGHDATH